MVKTLQKSSSAEAITTVSYKMMARILVEHRIINNDAAMPIYGKNPSNIFFSETDGLISKYYNMYINHDTVMTLT